MTDSLFKQQVTAALTDTALQTALKNVKNGLTAKRHAAVTALPEYERIRRQAVRIKNKTLDQLDTYLLEYEKHVTAHGGRVHWAETPEAACEIIEGICRDAKAEHIVKGKSMVTEEIHLNAHLEKQGYEVTETDLGEYIIQLAEETPSHIIAPAIHKTKEQVARLFGEKHKLLDGVTEHSPRVDLVAEARRMLRQKFLAADVGITGANFLIAESGQHVLVTNEGNGDLCSLLPDTHIVVSGIEKVLPTRQDVGPFLRLLTRSAVGQHISNYVSFFSGPKKPEDRDGPSDFHVVLVDNGRSQMLNSEFKSMLRCVRCGACLNHCPVYGAIGGHAYHSVYSGPMGAVFSPLLEGLKKHGDLPNACTLNGRCQVACPMDIPLPDMIRQLRHQEWSQTLNSRASRWGLGCWAFITRHPGIYRLFVKLAIRLLAVLKGRSHYIKYVPFGQSWSARRDFPLPETSTFMEQWKKKKG